MVINIVTIFPEFYESFLNTSLIKKSLDKGVLKFNIVDLKKFGEGEYRKVDDTPYGGGPGMVLKVDVIKRALESIKEKGAVIALTPKGETHTQEKAVSFSKLNTITILNGRYEGFDERVFEYVNYKISIGNFVTMGGESPSLSLIESIVRLVPGVVGKIESTENESFSEGTNRKHAVYTKPEEFEGKKVPEILLSGNHAEIEKWKKRTNIPK